MLVSKYGYRRDKKGNWVKKLYSELNNSGHFLLVKCDECRKLYKTVLSNRNLRMKKSEFDICKSCSKKGERNPSYGKDRKDLMLYARSFSKFDSMKGKHHSIESRKKMSKRKVDSISTGKFNILSNNRGYKSWYTSSKNGEQFHADSALEHLRMVQLDKDDDIISWTKRHKIRIEYTYENMERYCTPDFCIEYENNKVIEEVKGRVTNKELAKKEAISKWCKNNGYGFRFVTQKDLNKNGEYRKFIKELNKQ